MNIAWVCLQFTLVDIWRLWSMCKFSLYSYKTHVAAPCSHRSYAGHVNWSQHHLNVLRPNAFWYTSWNNVCPPPCISNHKCANYTFYPSYLAMQFHAKQQTIWQYALLLSLFLLYKDLIKCTHHCLHIRELDCVWNVQIHAAFNISVLYLAEYSLVQFVPFMVYPGLHEQLYPPSILMHVALWWQLCVFSMHSSISAQNNACGVT